MNKNMYRFGVAVQPGSAAVAPVVASGATADSPGIDAAVSSESTRMTIGKRDTTIGRYATETAATAQVQTIALADVLGLLAYAALGSDEVSGTAAPYTHSIKLGESLPKLTWTEQKGATDAPVQQMTGCVVDNLTIDARSTAPVDVSVTVAGTSPTWAAGAWSGADTDLTDGWYTAAGCEVLFSPNSGTPAAPGEGIVLSTAQVAIANNVSAQTALGSPDPVRQTEGSATVTASLTGTTDSTELYRIVKTGSASGTELSRETVTGSLQITFPHTTDANRSLVIKMMSVPWTIEAMNVSPDGGPFDLSLSTEGAITVDGTSVEILIDTPTASYAS